MRDEEIRVALHRTVLQRYHRDARTLVVDELGLQHGRWRADIAVVNGQLNGYEIKGNEDSLSRLMGQVEGYSAVFDRATAVVAERHLERVWRLVPCWWGVVVCTEGPGRVLRFTTMRTAARNRNVDGLAVARLLWKDEAAALLAARGASSRVLSSKRAVLYAQLVDLTSRRELGRLVREQLKRRKMWRCPPLPSRDGDSSPRPARS
jgi:hypothetical protein